MILNLDASKASGPDEISVRMIRGTAPSIAPILAQIFNTSIKIGKIPSVWNTNSSTDPLGYVDLFVSSLYSQQTFGEDYT